MIFVECDADEAVVRILGVPRKQFRHLAGKNKTLQYLRKKGRGLCVVDEDPQSEQARELTCNYRLSERAGGLQLHVEKSAAEMKVVVVEPMLEAWLLNRARAVEIDSTAYGLADDPKKLHGTPHYEEKPKFRAFIEDLLEKDQAVGQLQSWLRLGVE